MSNSTGSVFQNCAEQFSGDDTAILQCVSDSYQQSTESSELNIRTFLMVICGAMIFFMQTGFAMLCAGSVRLKNVQNTMLKNLLDACGCAIAWFLFGKSIMRERMPVNAPMCSLSFTQPFVCPQVMLLPSEATVIPTPPVPKPSLVRATLPVSESPPRSGSSSIPSVLPVSPLSLELSPNVVKWLLISVTPWLWQESSIQLPLMRFGATQDSSVAPTMILSWDLV